MEPFKNFFNPQLIANMATHFARHSTHFDRQGFIDDALDGFETLELKQRSAQITVTMSKHLNADFHKTASLILASLDPTPSDDLKDAKITNKGIAGWVIMPVADYVAQHGLDDFETSMPLLKELTKRFTSEFAIRPFLIHAQKRTMAQMLLWAVDDNRHVRRLASEGSRPRLPWATQLPELIQDPLPLIPLLNLLKDDPEIYVRKSVANNLNDIAKDHPDVVVSVAESWLKDASDNRQRLVKHACRSLIKQGHKKTLSALGYSIANVKINTLKIAENVAMSNSLPFSLNLTSLSKQAQPLIIDYVIHHKKAGGHTTAKVFKWKTFELGAGADITLNKKHAFKKISTRVYHAGTHVFELKINGESMFKQSFELLM